MSKYAAHDWAMARLDEPIDRTSSRTRAAGARGTCRFSSRRGSKAPRSDVVERVDAIEPILNRYLSEWRDPREECIDEDCEFEDIRTAAIRCYARLAAGAKVAAHLGPSGAAIRVD